VNKLAVIKSSKNKIKTQRGLTEAIYYITNDEKCFAKCYASGNEFDGVTVSADFFTEIQQIHGKQSGILAHHYFQSFNPEDNITPELAHKIGMEFINRVAPNYEVIVATHKDRDHVHNHFIINSVNTITGYKWHDNNNTVNYLRKISDELCKKYSLHVIGESDNKGIDQTTYQLAIKGKSWKIDLIKILDEAINTCHTKLDFMDYLNKNGFKVNYQNKNITVWKEGEKKIRLDTLARQFGDKYKKENLEKAMGYTDGDFQNIVPKKRTPKLEPIYNGEWRRLENWIFENHKANYSDLPTVYENCPLEKLLNADGENARAEIDLIELVKLHNADFFFSAQKKKDTATVNYKKYNQKKLEQRVLVLIQVEEIIKPEIEKEKRYSQKEIDEKIRNARLHNEIKKQSALQGEKPCYKIITAEQLEKVKESGAKFACFSKQDKFNICYLKDEEQKINSALFTQNSQNKNKKGQSL
jgi:hypothetical protein